MADKSTQRKPTKAQIKEQTARILEVVEEHKRLVKKGEGFTAVTPEDIERKLTRTNSPMIVSQTGSWTVPTPAGGTFTYNLGLFNPDPTDAVWLFAHVWVGSGNVDPVPGTFLLNVDPRFPRVTLPAFAGLTLPANGSTVLTFNIKVPARVQKTNYLGNSCLMQVNWHDVGQYLDRGVFVFTVS